MVGTQSVQQTFTKQEREKKENLEKKLKYQSSNFVSVLSFRETSFTWYIVSCRGDRDLE